jgi:fumarate reductase flavoprotein subunit
MSKRIISFLFVMVFAFAVLSCSKQEVIQDVEEEVQEITSGKFNPGTYVGKATGYGGEVTATVVLSEDRIESITCNGDKETNGIGQVAIKELSKEIVSRQSVQVDAISGATISSTAMKDAVTQALTLAGADVSALMPVSAKPIGVVTPIEEKLSVDLVVIGAGGAGITAALEAKEQGLDVIVLEKRRMAGGNTLRAAEGRDDTIKVGEANSGAYFIEAWLEKLKEDHVEILFQTKATKLILEDGKITGVAASGQSKDYQIQCKAVVLATGGYGANNEMIATFAKDYDQYKTTNSDASLGDGILMAQEVGAKIVHMDQIQVYPTVEVKTNTIIAESLRDYGAILVNQNGERFFNESSSRDLVSRAIMAQEGEDAYLIFDQQLREKLSVIDDYVSLDLVEKEDKLSDLAKVLGVDVETLNKTLQEWNTNLSSGLGDNYNRTLDGYQSISVGPYYAIKVTPAIHYTLGGVEITSKAEVVARTGLVIPGLYAAGEVTGGIQGETKADSNSIDDLILYGRMSAQSSAIYIKTQYNSDDN